MLATTQNEKITSSYHNRNQTTEFENLLNMRIFRVSLGGFSFLFKAQFCVRGRLVEAKDSLVPDGSVCLHRQSIHRWSLEGDIADFTTIEFEKSNMATKMAE